MRITYLHQYFNTPEMAGGTRSYEMARRLVARGHEVTMVTSWRTDKRSASFETYESGIRVIWLPVPYSNKMSFSQRILSFIRFAWLSSQKASRVPADVIFATSTPLTIAIPAIYAKRVQKVPMVFEVRDLWPQVPIALGVLKRKPTIFLAKMLERFAYRNSSRVVALAPGMKEGVVESGYPADRVDVIPNGADLEVFQNVETESENLKMPVALASKRIILYSGTVGPANGVSYIVDLADAIMKNHPHSNMAFVVIGDGREMNNVINKAIALGVKGKNIFFLGRQPKKEVAVWMRCAEATIMTYCGPEILYRDSVSNKFFDSMAGGRPVFSNFRGFSTVIAQQQGAGVILPQDINDASYILLQHMGSSKWIRQASCNALEMAGRYFDRDVLAESLNRSLERVVMYGQFQSEKPEGEHFVKMWRNLGESDVGAS